MAERIIYTNVPTNVFTDYFSDQKDIGTDIVAAHAHLYISNELFKEGLVKHGDILTFVNIPSTMEVDTSYEREILVFDGYRDKDGIIVPGDLITSIIVTTKKHNLN